MNKIIVIGCPGSGKSTMVKKMNAKLNYPILHLDKVYHINNDKHITREELRQIVSEFNQNNKKWIIDGNYISTAEERMLIADTIILLKIDTEICVKNAYNRSNKERQHDMAAGFDNSIISQDFINFIQNFNTQTLPIILDLLKKYENEKTILVLKNYEEVDSFLNAL
jgi:adenylate kinase family enzyme